MSPPNPFTPVPARRAAAPRLATALLAVGALVGCASDPPPDVLVVTVDTLRADALGCLGYPRDATPHLDRLAGQGVLFERHYTTSSQTAPAHASLFSGLMPSEHGLVKNGTPLSPTVPWLPEVLAARGWRTGAAIGALVLAARDGFDRGFEWFDEDMRAGSARSGGGATPFERPAAQVVDRALAWLDHQGDAPVFLWVHVFDPHDPYAPPEPPPLAPLDDLSFHRRRAEPSDLFPRELAARLRAGYEAEVSYTDHHLGRLLAAWDARGRDSLVVVTSDHGEGLGEHGYQGHHFYLYEEQAHVPLIVRARGPLAGELPAGTRVEAVTSHLDIAGSLRQWLGLPAAPGGRNLAPRVAAPGPDPDARALLERRAFSAFDLESARPLQELLEAHAGRPGGARGELWALVGPTGKLIEASDVGPELFDLERDPAEAVNLAGAEPGRLERAQRELAERRAALAPTSPGARPLTPEEAAERRRMLDALGY